MARSIIGVIVGYIVMFMLQVAVLMTVYTVMGPDWSFKPASYQASTRWTLMQFAVILTTAVIAGLVCALIANGGKAPLVLAGLVLGLGLALGALGISMKPDTNEVRTGDVPNMEAMSKAKQPMWVVFVSPVLGSIGVVAGGKLRRRR